MTSPGEMHGIEFYQPGMKILYADRFGTVRKGRIIAKLEGNWFSMEDLDTGAEFDVQWPHFVATVRTAF